MRFSANSVQENKIVYNRREDKNEGQKTGKKL